jgi:hypothetical protein
MLEGFAKESLMFDVALRGLTAMPRRLPPVRERYAPLFCFALLTAACALSSFAFACATPFAAFAVIAAATLSLRSALLVMLAAWLVNQAIGFCALGYPYDFDTMAWGLVIGAAALAATIAAVLVLRTASIRLPIASGLALASAYAAYEFVLVAATPALGGAGDFTLAIVGHLTVLNVLWFLGLFAACEIARLLGARRQIHDVCCD